MIPGRRTGGRVAVAVAAMLIAVPAIGAKQKQKPEVIAQVRAVASNPTGGNSNVQIRIFEWTTDEERQGLLKALADGGNTALYDLLHEQDEKARLRIPGHMDAPMRYAYHYEQDGKHHVVLGTDRPLGFGEAGGGTRTSRYSLSLVYFELDAETGKGDGQIIAGARFVWDKDAGRMVPEGFSGQPIRLRSVKLVEPKKKKK